MHQMMEWRRQAVQTAKTGGKGLFKSRKARWNQFREVQKGKLPTYPVNEMTLEECRRLKG